MKMIGKAFVLCVMLLAVMTVSVCAAPERLLDEADWLTDSEEYVLSNTLDTVSERYDCDIVAVAADDLGGRDVDEYAEYVYDRYFAYDGVLLLISDEGNYILTSGECYFLLGDAWFDMCVDAVADDIDAGFYADAIDTFARMCDSGLSDADGWYAGGFDYDNDGGYDSDHEFEWMKYLFLSLVIGFVMALIVVSVMKSQLRSVKPQAAAAQYVRQGSFVLSAQNDLFLYSHVSRVAKPKNNSSSGSRRAGRSSGGGARGGRRF